MSRIYGSVLENGCRLVNIRDNHFPDVTAAVVFRSGATRERSYEHQGMHLNEHMIVCRGTSEEHTEALCREFVAKGIDVGGATGFRHTRVEYSGPARKLSFMLRDALESCQKDYAPDQFVLEKRAVDVELRSQSGKDVLPYLIDKMHAMLFDTTRFGLTYGQELTGLQQLTKGRTQNLLERVFRPDQIVVIVAGKLPNERVKQAVEHTFGTLPPSRRPLEDYPYVPQSRQDRWSVHERGREASYIQHTLRCDMPDAKHLTKQLSLLYVLSSTLVNQNTGRSISRIDLQARTRKGYVYTPSCDIDISGPEALFSIMYETRPEETMETMTLVHDILHDLAHHSLSRAEFLLHKQVALKQFRKMLREPSSVIDLYADAATFNVRFQPQAIERRIKTMTPATLQRAVKRWLPGMGIVIACPKGMRSQLEETIRQSAFGQSAVHHHIETAPLYLRAAAR